MSKCLDEVRAAIRRTSATLVALREEKKRNTQQHFHRNPSRFEDISSRSEPPIHDPIDLALMSLDHLQQKNSGGTGWPEASESVIASGLSPFKNNETASRYGESNRREGDLDSILFDDEMPPIAALDQAFSASQGSGNILHRSASLLGVRG
jgi:hypothetical protein